MQNVSLSGGYLPGSNGMGNGMLTGAAAIVRFVCRRVAYFISTSGMRRELFIASLSVEKRQPVIHNKNLI
ncbi:hypothetical protein OWK27_00095 [Enterobacter cloacae complex sp. 2022EL-00788]|uniref:hypothetical protein n=1 Tax=Enterobacter cloacae complex sp. 2022EL-00788 TaxID=2996512 RepID=UPI00226D5139|nr:hypothetical protein [Enterobacter cloacae complex sp. 2022EL-00788]MCY0771115.1 hypothetical protein [Enterobacter cloacae complex sp. 2022EL-00788]